MLIVLDLKQCLISVFFYFSRGIEYHFLIYFDFLRHLGFFETGDFTLTSSFACTSYTKENGVMLVSPIGVGLFDQRTPSKFSAQLTFLRSRHFLIPSMMISLVTPNCSLN